MKRKGSYTIEATLCMPIIIGILIFIIYLAFYTHARSVLTECAYIAALRGSLIQSGNMEAEREAAKYAEELIQDKLLGNWVIENNIKVTEDKIVVLYYGTMHIPGGLLLDYVLHKNNWKLKVEASAKRINEVKYIRNMRVKFNN